MSQANPSTLRFGVSCDFVLEMRIEHIQALYTPSSQGLAPEKIRQAGWHRKSLETVWVGDQVSIRHGLFGKKLENGIKALRLSKRIEQEERITNQIKADLFLHVDFRSESTGHKRWRVGSTVRHVEGREIGEKKPGSKYELHHLQCLTIPGMLTS